jgi:hypothetical protein
MNIAFRIKVLFLLLFLYHFSAIVVIFLVILFFHFYHFIYVLDTFYIWYITSGIKALSLA